MSLEGGVGGGKGGRERGGASKTGAGGGFASKAGGSSASRAGAVRGNAPKGDAGRSSAPNAGTTRGAVQKASTGYGTGPSGGAARGQAKPSARSVALEVLTAVEQEGAYSNLLLNGALQKSGLSGPDAGLATELVYGTIQRLNTIDFFLAPFVTKGLGSLLRGCAICCGLAFTSFITWTGSLRMPLSTRRSISPKRGGIRVYPGW